MFIEMGMVTVMGKPKPADAGDVGKYPSSAELCEAITFSQVLEVLKLALPKRGRFKCPNPDHEDQHPSAKAGRSKTGDEVFYCHACGAKGNVIHLTMMLRGCSRPAAKDWLRETFLPRWQAGERAIPHPRFSFRDYDAAEARVMADNPLPREGFQDIYREQYWWLLRAVGQWEIEKVSWGERIRRLKRWEDRLLSLYRARMRDGVSSAAREKAEKEGWPDGLAEQIEVRLRHQRKRFVTR